MKKRRIVIIALAAALCAIVLACLLTACNDKQTGDTYTITFEAGEVDVADIVAKAGATITPPADPESDKYYFGGWYLSSDFLGSAVQLPTTMPAQNITYYARWYVSYAVNVYKQPESMSTDHADYVLDEERSKLYEGTAGATVDLYGSGQWPIRIDGFRDTTDDDSLYSLKLTGKDNERNVYFDRLSYTLTLYADNDPESGETLTVYYGVDVMLEDVFGIAGRRLRGYSTDPNSTNLTYKLDTAYKFTQNTNLYAVWNLGYADRDGGDDYIYTDVDDRSVVWLEREGLEDKKGVYDPQTGQFCFKDGDDKILSGSLYNKDRSFSYTRDGSIDYYYVDVNTGEISEGSKITLGADGKATILIEDGIFTTYKIGNDYSFIRATLPAGTYENVEYSYEYGEYIFSVFDGGTGEEYTFAFTTGLVGTMQDTSPDLKYFDAFLPRGEEAGYYTSDFTFDEATGYIQFSQLTVLDGYGNAECLDFVNDEQEYWLGSYQITEGDLGLPEVIISDGTNYAYFIVDWTDSFVVGALSDGTMLYQTLAFDDNGYGEYVNNDGDTLSITGYGIALYSAADSDKPVQYLYEVVSPYDFYDAMGASVINLYNIQDDGSRGSLQGTYYAEMDMSFSGTDTFERVSTSAELKYLTDLSSASEILFTDGDEGVLYTLQPSEYFVDYLYYAPTAVGNISYDIASRMYTFQVTYGYIDDFKYYEMHDTYYVEGTLAFDDVTFAGADGVSKVRLEYNGEAVYTDAAGVEHIGRYWNFEEGVLTFGCSDLSCDVAFDFTVDDAKRTYTPILPSIEGKEYIRYNLHNAKLIIAEDNKAEVQILVEGEFQKAASGVIEEYDLYTGKYIFRQPVVVEAYKEQYDAIFGAGEFIFILGYDEVDEEEVECFDIKDGLEGKYEFESGNVLELDGFGYATYTVDDEEIKGIYYRYVDLETYEVVGLAFIDEDGSGYYFDFFDDGSLHERGIEGGMEAQLTDGKYAHPIYIVFDGYGNVELDFVEEIKSSEGDGDDAAGDDSEKEAYAIYMLNENGTYEFTGERGHYYVHLYFDEFYEETNDSGTLTQEEADMLNAFVANLGKYGIRVDEDGYADFELVFVLAADNDVYFYIKDPDAELHIIFDDWSILKTDGLYTATYTDKYGKVYEGNYDIEKEGEGDDAYRLVRFYNNYYDFAFIIEADGTAYEVGYEVGQYVIMTNNELVSKLILDGLGNAVILFPDPDHVGEFMGMNGTYTFDENLARIDATFTAGNGESVEWVIELYASAYTRTFAIKNDKTDGEFTDEKDPGRKMYGNGFGEFLLDGNIYYLIGESVDQEGLYYFLNAKDMPSDGKIDESKLIEVRMDLEARTFLFANPDASLSAVPLYDIYTGKIKADNVAEIDGFGNVTIGGEKVGMYVSHTRAEGGGYSNYDVYVYQKEDGTQVKFAVFKMGINSYSEAYAPYVEKYDVTLTASSGSGTIVLDGMACAKVSGEDDTVLHNYFAVTDTAVTIYDFYNGVYGSKAMYNVDWQTNKYLVGEDAAADGFVIVNGILTQYTGTATEIVIPGGVSEIADGVFAGKDIVSVDLANVVKIGERAFEGSGMTTSTLKTVTGDKVETIGKYAFHFNIIESIFLPAVVSIDEQAFNVSLYLREVELGANLQTLGYRAFYNTALKTTDKAISFKFAGEHAPILQANLGVYETFGSTTSVKRTIAFEKQSAYEEALTGANGWSEYLDGNCNTTISCSEVAASISAYAERAIAVKKYAA